ncbi:hypothetical protein [Celeribacter sp.]|uniref:hypothetical protein n=1 Tax=Celeribacter sp. TaxID=1890673 RepID=UPI003A8E55CD
MIREKENPGAGATASGAISRVPASKTHAQNNTRVAIFWQFVSSVADGIFSLFGAVIDLRAVAWSVRGAVRRKAVRHG